MKKKGRVFSVRFSYSMAKSLSGWKGPGSTSWWAARASKIYGHSPEELCPSDIFLKDEDCTEKNISAVAFLAAQKHRTDYYQRLYSLEDAMYAMQKGLFSINFDVFESISLCKDGYIKIPEIGEKLIDSHSVSAVGYSQKEKYIKFKNSWGFSWGDKGYGYLPFEYFNQDLVSEMWAYDFYSKPNNEERFYIRSKKKKSAKVSVLYYPSFRYHAYSMVCFDVYIGDSNLLIGFAHACPQNQDNLELEELYFLSQYQNEGFGKNLLKLIEEWAKHHKFKKIIGWIGAQDLIDGKDKKVELFFKKRRYSLVEDNSRFRDSVYKVEKTLKIYCEPQ